MRYQNTLRGYAVVLEETEVAVKFDRFLRATFDLAETCWLSLDFDDDGETEFSRDDFSGLTADIINVQVYNRGEPIGELTLTPDIVCGFANADWSGVEFYAAEIYGESK